ncbi:hypothetical protein PN490_01405 [Nodularia spumigena CS-588/01]|nr:hypothetical protein [Nodularia spumigena]MDB9346433.1 hypothetical protein [Nodularia spumigena CS-588/01]
MSSSQSSNKRFVYREFGNDNSAATQRGVPELPPQQQNLKVEASRKGRKG